LLTALVVDSNLVISQSLRFQKVSLVSVVISPMLVASSNFIAIGWRNHVTSRQILRSVDTTAIFLVLYVQEAV